MFRMLLSCQAYDLQTFAHSVRCLFILLILSSDTQHLKILTKFTESIFSLVARAFSVVSKKSPSDPVSRGFARRLLYSFLVLALPCRSSIHVELPAVLRR